jgi:hypothetical protein
MKHATSRELFDYWNRVRDGAPAARRSDIEPSDIRVILADTFILQCADRERYPIRLAGTRMCSAFGREMRGDDFRGLWKPSDRDAVAALGTAISVDGAAAVITAEGRTERGRALGAEVLMLPLRHNGPNFDRILGSFAAADRPYWYGNEPLTALSIVSLRLIWPDEAPHFLRRTTDRPPPLNYPVEIARSPSRRHGHLTVFDGGKG